MGPKPTAVDQAGRPPRKLMAVPLRFETNASSGCFESNRFDDIDKVGTADIGGCEDIPNIVFIGDEGFQNTRRCFECTGHSARAAPAGHSRDGDGVRFLVHAVAKGATLFKL